MSAHLSDHDLAAAVAGLGLDPERERHLADCLLCRRQVGEMAELVMARRVSLTDEAPDWDAQHSAILGRLEGSPMVAIDRRRRWSRPLLAAAAVLLVAGIGLQRMPGGGGESEEVPVEQILAEVDATLAGEAVPGFEGLDPIVPDMDEIRELFTNGTS